MKYENCNYCDIKKSRTDFLKTGELFYTCVIGDSVMLVM